MRRSFLGTVSLSRASVLNALFAVAAIVGATFLVGQTIAIAIETHRTLPLIDEWSNLAVFESVRDGRSLVDALFSQHNEHRIAVPRLVLFADYLWFAGSGWFDLGVIWLVQLLHAALLGALLVVASPRERGTLALAALPFLLLFSLRQGETLTWPFGLPFACVFAAASLALALFAEAAGPQRSRSSSAALVAGAFLFATAAALSMTNGLVVAPVLVAQAVMARSARLTLASLLFAIGLIAAFSIGYSVGDGHEALDGWVHNPVRLVAYTAAYLGSYLDADLGSATALGAAGLAATLFFVIRLAFERERSPARLALIGIVLFVAGTAFMTALGRSFLGMDGALASRYATGSAVFWSALIALAWSLADAWLRPVATRVLVGAVAVVLVVAGAQAQAPARAYLRDLASKQALLEDGVLAGFIDPAAAEALQDPPEAVPAGVRFLERNRMSVFATPEGDLRGHVLAGAAAARPCPGAFAAAVTAPDLGLEATRVSGSLDGPRPRGIRRVLIVEPSGRVAGFASTGFGAGAWTGYATAAPGTRLAALSQPNGQDPCRLGEHIVTDAAAPQNGARP